MPEKVTKVWAPEWAKEGRKVDWQRLMPSKEFKVLPRRWVMERTFAWLGHISPRTRVNRYVGGP